MQVSERFASTKVYAASSPTYRCAWLFEVRSGVQQRV